ncbi:MAG: hypothetical protein V1493_03480 [Candidatus Diapherotrites archaeon]
MPRGPIRQSRTRREPWKLPEHRGHPKDIVKNPQDRAKIRTLVDKKNYPAAMAVAKKYGVEKEPFAADPYHELKEFRKALD